MAHNWADNRPVYYGTAAERVAFPAAGEAAGALFFDYDDETWYYWDGAAWQTVDGALPAHTHTAIDGGQLDWDDIWTDGVHDHSAAGEGGQLDWDSIWSDAVHDHSSNAEGGQLIDLNGAADALVLSAAGTDSLSAPTDGQWDFEVGGADEAHLTAYGLSAQNHAFRVKNSSGGAVTPGDVGYIDTAEYKETTTAYSDVAWCVVVQGGADAADIYVARRGRVTVVLNGNCSAGDYLYTSTTAGQAQPQSYIRPELFAVALTANAAGAGGTCTALLLCNTQPVSATNSEVYFIVGHSDLDFVATINGAPVGAAVVYNAPSSGSEDTIAPYSPPYNYKLVLHNTTRGDSALINSVNVVTNTITLTANVPVAWANGDTISARSQTAAGTLGDSRWYELDVNGSVPALVRTLDLFGEMADGGTIGQFMAIGTVAATPQCIVNARTQVAGAYTYIGASTRIGLINGRFVVAVTASGLATANSILRQVGYFVAAP